MGGLSLSDRSAEFCGSELIFVLNNYLSLAKSVVANANRSSYFVTGFPLFLWWC